MWISNMPSSRCAQMNKIQIYVWFTILFLVCSAQGYSQTSTYVDDQGKHTVAWDDMVGSVVQFDGIAWGAYAKGLGAHVVMPRDKIYVKNVDLVKSDLNGRLVRITGLLKKERMQPAAKGVQGYGQAFDYFTVETVAVERIEKVRLSQVLPSKRDWIVPGMDSKKAFEFITKRNLQPYQLALMASQDGSKTHSYLVSEGLVVVFRVFNGKVVSVSSLELNGPGKVDDEWVAIPAFELSETGKKSQ